LLPQQENLFLLNILGGETNVLSNTINRAVSLFIEEIGRVAAKRQSEGGRRGRKKVVRKSWGSGRMAFWL
jgi:hypothetical protein